MVANGFEIAEHPGAAGLLARLDDPRTVEALHRLLDRADLLALAAESADELMRRGDTIIDSIGDTFKDVRKMAGSAEPFTDLAGQLPQLAATGTKVAKLSNTAAFQNLLDSGLLEQLGDPATIERLHEIFGQLELVSFSLKMLDGFIRRGEELVDNIAAAVADARKTGTGIATDDLQVLKETGEGLLGAAKQLHQNDFLTQLPSLIDTLVQLLDSGIFQPKIVSVLTEVGLLASQSYVNTKASKTGQAGPMDIWRAMKDPDVQRSIGFMLGMCKQYGKTIR